MNEKLFDYLDKEVTKNELQENEFILSEFMESFKLTETTALRILKRMEMTGKVMKEKRTINGHNSNVWRVNTL